MSTKLFIGNISWGATEDMLADAFSEAGEVVSVTIIKDKFSGRSKGFGFVEMATEEAAQAAVEKLNDKEIDGRPIRVDIAKEREER